MVPPAALLDDASMEMPDPPVVWLDILISGAKIFTVAPLVELAEAFIADKFIVPVLV